MTKRVNAYTSTSIGKDMLVTLNEMQAYLKEKFGLMVSHQNINDKAIERAWAERDAFGKALMDADPEMAEFLRLQARLKAKGRL